MLRVAHRAATRLLVAGVLTVGAGGATLALTPTPAFASSSSMEAQFVADMNAARSAAGLRPYAVYSDLTSVARSHSAAMARQQNLYHNPSLTSDISNWQAIGENVGEGPTVSDIHTAFMNSPEHRANILDHDFTQVGVGVTVDSNGIVWVTEDFRQPMYSSSSSSSSTTTHHSTSQTSTSSHPTTVTHHTTTVTHYATAAAPMAQPTARPVAHRPVHHVAHPAPAKSPQALLLARLAAVRSAAAQAPSTDPVDAAFDYLNNVTSVTSAA